LHVFAKFNNYTAFQDSALDGGSISAFNKLCIFVMLEFLVMVEKYDIGVTAKGCCYVVISA
jgi:hypothetical protein